MPLINWLEAGRRPAGISLLVAASLALLTAIRFLVLVSVMPPADYGALNIFTTLCSLLPSAMSLGLTPQYQRIAFRRGPSVVPGLLRTSVLVTLSVLVPTLIVVLAIAAPVTTGAEVWLISIAVVVIGSATVLTIFSSQAALGLGRRSTASLMMFAVNAASSLALLPAIISHKVTPLSLLGWWAGFSILAAAAAYLTTRSMGRQPEKLKGVVSFGEGLGSLPGQVGPWLFIFMIRYFIGINLDVAAVAIYAISATIADMAFLVAVSLLNYFTNRVMSGAQGPARGLSFALPLFFGLFIVGTSAVAVLLPVIGADGYYVAPEISIWLGAGGVVRLYLSAWRPLALGRKRMHVASIAFAVVIAASLATLVAWPFDQLWPYAAITVAGFLVVALAQRISVRNTAR